MIRRWTDDEKRTDAASSRPLLDATNIYRPVKQDLRRPTVHTVSVCPLGEASAKRSLDCRTTAFVGPSSAEWYVSETDAYLWTSDWSDSSRDCEQGEQFDSTQIVPALLYQVPVNGNEPKVIAARGTPFDQFSLLASKGRFRAILHRDPNVCNEDWDHPAEISYFDIPLSTLSATVSEAGDGQYAKLPGVGSRWIVNRFTEDYLVYGSLSRYRRGLPKIDPDDDEDWVRRMRAMTAIAPLYVVPVSDPSAVSRLNVRHTVIRAEQAGQNVIVTGYRDQRGLEVSLIDLRRRPHIGSSAAIEGRFESEGRSHAFNSLIEENGSGVMGLPTVPRISGSERYSWRSEASDLSFLTLNSSGRLTPAGELLRKQQYDDDGDSGIKGYECEVSCIDWYGNSRPIFTDGRIFALAGAELIEGRLDDGAIYEVQRLNIALSRPQQVTASQASVR